MFATSVLIFAMTTFFVLFLVRSAHNIAKGKVVTLISLTAWGALVCGLYLVW